MNISGLSLAYRVNLNMVLFLELGALPNIVIDRGLKVIQSGRS